MVPFICIHWLAVLFKCRGFDSDVQNCLWKKPTHTHNNVFWTKWKSTNGGMATGKSYISPLLPKRDLCTWFRWQFLSIACNKNNLRKKNNNKTNIQLFYTLISIFSCIPANMCAISWDLHVFDKLKLNSRCFMELHNEYIC